MELEEIMINLVIIFPAIITFPARWCNLDTLTFVGCGVLESKQRMSSVLKVISLKNY